MDGYKHYGSQDNCSTFLFENHTKTLKSMLRQSDNPLEKVVRRYKKSKNFIYKNDVICDLLSIPLNIIVL